MGCDIHFHTEIKVAGVWHHYSHPRIGRRYALFTKLAGVRNCPDVDPVSAPKGLPEDASWTTLFDYNREKGYHNASWIGVDEIAEVVRWVDDYYHGGINPEWDIFGYLLDNAWQPQGDVEDVRWVFWFDN